MFVDVGVSASLQVHYLISILHYIHSKIAKKKLVTGYIWSLLSLYIVKTLSGLKTLSGRTLLAEICHLVPHVKTLSGKMALSGVTFVPMFIWQSNNPTPMRSGYWVSIIYDSQKFSVFLLKIHVSSAPLFSSIIFRTPIFFLLPSL